MRHRAEEEVNRRAAAHLVCLRLVEPDVAARKEDALIGRDAVDTVGLDADGLRHLLHGHCRLRLKHFGEAALVPRRRVQDDGVRQPAVGGRVLEEAHQRLDAARRSADADEHQAVILLAVTFLHKARALSAERRPFNENQL